MSLYALKAFAYSDDDINDPVLKAEARQALARIAELEAALTWRPIAEAPRVYRELAVLWVSWEDAENPDKWVKGFWDPVRKWRGTTGHWVSEEDGEVIFPTHFLPAPEPPKEEQPK